MSYETLTIEREGLIARVWLARPEKRNALNLLALEEIAAAFGELQQAFAPIAQAWQQKGHAVALGIGIAQGEATLGVIGFEQRWEYAAIGAIPNLAARLCGQARPGEILIDAVTYADVGDATIQDLRSRGHKVEVRKPPLWQPTVLRLDHATGLIQAAGDPKGGRHAAAWRILPACRPRSPACSRCSPSRSAAPACSSSPA